MFLFVPSVLFCVIFCSILFIWACCAVAKMWVQVESKMAKKGYSHIYISQLIPNPVFPKNEVLDSHILLTH